MLVMLESVPNADAGYFHHGEEGGGFGDNNHHYQDHEHVHLGTFVGKHMLPPKVIHITKTVAVKVPVPYPVKVPHHIPYPVPVPKPYPVHVPKIIKITEQVPIEVPTHHHHGSDEGSHDEHSFAGGSNGGKYRQLRSLGRNDRMDCCNFSSLLSIKILY